jgi:hypothetical protein
MVDMFQYRLADLTVMFVILIIVWPFTVPAQQNTSTHENESEAAVLSASNPTDQAILEEVLVIGQSTPVTIRRELFNTQDLVCDIFNELNEDDAYDMVCKKEARNNGQPGQ